MPRSRQLDSAPIQNPLPSPPPSLTRPLPSTPPPQSHRSRPVNVRRSGRLTGKTPEYGEVKGDLAEGGAAVTYEDYEAEALDDLLAGEQAALG